MHSDLSNKLLTDELAVLRQENAHLRQENQRLHTILFRHGIDDSPNPVSPVISNTTNIHARHPYVTKKSSFSDKSALFLSLFCGRQDVYA